MGDEVLRESWLCVLLEHGFVAGERTEALVQLLMKNLFTKLSQLRYADHPRTWVGASQFSEKELQELWQVKTACRSRSR